MKVLCIIAASCFAFGCETTPDDPLGHYAYVEPVRDLMPMFAAWDSSLPSVPSIARRDRDPFVTTAPLYAARPR